jgi:hypothetical protein
VQNTEQTQLFTRRSLTKIYIEGETKEQRKARKSIEKAQKSVASLEILPQENVKRFVCCLKYGNKYSADYVNKLYNMVQRHLTLDHQFVCYTEDPKDIDPNIRIEPLETLPGIQGWWYKPMFFNPKIGIDGTLLFLDLDMIIFDNIDKLFTYKPGEFCIIQDFNRYVVKNYNKFNSSIFRLDTHKATHKNVYEDFIKDPKIPITRYHGDQDWIRKCIQKDYNYWPEDWIQSYKWEMRGKPKFNGRPRGERDFLEQAEPVVKAGTAIAVFHGDPNPHNCKDPWVLEHWQ